MNAHDKNSVFRAMMQVASPEFTRKLSYDEQRALSPEAFGRYCDWLFALNAPAAARRIMQEVQGNLDHDAEYERDRG